MLLLGNGYPVYASHNYLPDGNNPEVDNNLKKQKTIQGVVTDTNGEPIIGVTIIEKEQRTVQLLILTENFH